MRRFKILKITSELFRSLLLQDGTSALRTHGLPSDIQFVDFAYDPMYDHFRIKLESDSFPEVMPEACIEEIMPTVEQVYLDRRERDHIADFLQERGFAELAREIRLQRTEREHLLCVLHGDPMAKTPNGVIEGRSAIAPTTNHGARREFL